VNSGLLVDIEHICQVGRVHTRCGLRLAEEPWDHFLILLGKIERQNLDRKFLLQARVDGVINTSCRET
jgi:hypothetical protein